VGHEENRRARDQEVEGEDLILLSDVYVYAGRGLRFRRALDIGTVGFVMFLLTRGLVVELCYFHGGHPVSIYGITCITYVNTLLRGTYLFLGSAAEERRNPPPASSQLTLLIEQRHHNCHTRIHAATYSWCPRTCAVVHLIMLNHSCL